MKRIALIFFILPILFINAQTTDSIYQHPYSIGLGLCNSIPLLTNHKKDTSSKIAPSYFFDYKYKVDSVLFLRFNIVSKIANDKIASILVFNDFYVAVGIEKTHSPYQKLRWYYGGDLYYRMNLRRFKISASSWSSDYFGFGILAFTGLEYPINSNITIASEFNLGLGLHQIGVNNSSGIIEWALTGLSTRNISFGLRYFFNAP